MYAFAFEAIVCCVWSLLKLLTAGAHLEQLRGYSALMQFSQRPSAFAQKGASKGVTYYNCN